MAKAHVLESNGGGRTRVVWHFTTPAGNNSAGITWVAALMNSVLKSTTVLRDGTGSDGSISSAEKTGLGNGTVYEVVDSLDIPSGMTAPQANAFLDAHHASRQVEVFDQLQRQLRYAGFTRA